MTKKELEKQVEWLKERVEEQSSTLKKYEDKEEKEQYELREEINVLERVNRDYLEIIRWHVNKDTAMPVEFNREVLR